MRLFSIDISSGDDIFTIAIISIGKSIQFIGDVWGIRKCSLLFNNDIIVLFI